MDECLILQFFCVIVPATMLVVVVYCNQRQDLWRACTYILPLRRSKTFFEDQGNSIPSRWVALLGKQCDLFREISGSPSLPILAKYCAVRARATAEVCACLVAKVTKVRPDGWWSQNAIWRGPKCCLVPYCSQSNHTDPPRRTIASVQRTS